VDSELILGTLINSGHKIAAVQETEVIIVNTCGFIGDAKKESPGTILEMSGYKRACRCSALIVTGCRVVGRYREEPARELPEVDAFWGTGNLLKINEILDNAGKRG